jgi:hypothetical protein
MWFNLAAAGFPASDTNKRSAAVHNRGVVAGKMTPGQVAEAERLARTWNAVTDARVAANDDVLG